MTIHLARLLTVCLALIAAPAFAGPLDFDDWPRQHEGRWFVPVDLGVGPELLWLPGSLGGQPHTAVGIDLYAIAYPELIKHVLSRTKVPPQYQRFVRNLDTSSPMHVRRWPMQAIPAHLVVSPSLLGPDSAFGLAWDPLLIELGTGLGRTSSPLFFRVRAGLPTLSYLFVQSAAIDGGEAHVFGVGAQASATLVFNLSERFVVSLDWHSTLQWTNRVKMRTPGETVRLGGADGLVLADAAGERQWHLGFLGLMLHFRIPTYQAL